MQINLSGQHVDVTQSLRRHVENKLRRLERHYDQVTSVHVVLKTENQSQRAEATVHVPRGQLFAEATSPEMFAAIDVLADKLDRQIKRHKEKTSDHHRDEGGLKAR